MSGSDVRRQARLTRIALGSVTLSLVLAPAPTAHPVQNPLPQLGESARPTPYDPDPEHPWNRLHAALFRQRLRTNATPCLLEGSCQALAVERMFGELASVWFEEGGDGSTLLLRGNVAALAAPARLAEVEAALDAALAIRRDTLPPETALLLQHDLWERFDAAHAAREEAAEPGPRAALTHLQQRLGRAIRELALPASEIRAVRPNLEEVAQAHAELIDLGRASAWVEVTAYHRMGTGPESILPLHAANAGFRSSFRTLLRYSGDAVGDQALRALFQGGPAHVELPPGTRVALVESLLAVSSRGEPVAVPLITLVETRRVGPEAPPPARLSELDFAVLEGRRAWLAAEPRRSGGLERLEADAPVPDGASCLKGRGLVMPLLGSCVRCHAPRGARLPGLSRHGRTRLVLSAPYGSLQPAATIEAKLRDERFSALRRHFAGQ